MSDIVTVLIQIVSVVVPSAIVGEIFRRGLTALAKRAGSSRDVIRDIRGGLRIAWIVIVVAGVLIVTGIASEFQALTVTGLAGLAISLVLQTTLSNIVAGVLPSPTRPSDFTMTFRTAELEAQLSEWVSGRRGYELKRET